MIPAMFAALATPMQRTAMRHGYALAIHGSLRRDMDVVAIPWVDDADSPGDLIKALCRVHGLTDGGHVTQKPHGRLAYTLIIGTSRRYVDLSIMPRSAE